MPVDDALSFGLQVGSDGILLRSRKSNAMSESKMMMCKRDRCPSDRPSGKDPGCTRPPTRSVIPVAWLTVLGTRAEEPPRIRFINRPARWRCLAQTEAPFPVERR
jgi:hypothetical protein